MKRKLIFLALLVCSFLDAEEKGFKNLFNGKNFTGWTQKGGIAKYTIKDGMIIGTAVNGTPNSFLGTKKHYDDFVLE